MIPPVLPKLTTPLVDNVSFVLPAVRLSCSNLGLGADFGILVVTWKRSPDAASVYENP